MKKLLYIFFGLLLFGCSTDNNTQEETLALVQENNAITQELERLITMDDNDIAGKKKRFKNRFGKINYDNAHIYDDQGGSTLYPITKKNTITHWLVGYYQDGKIKFKIRKIDFDKEESVTLYKKGKMVFINKVGTYVNKKATTASKGCSVTYRKVCSYYDANENGTHDPDVDSNLVCSYYFNGIECDLPVMDAEDDPSLPTWNDTGLGDGGSNSWTNIEAILEELAPETPIEDVDKFFECFDTAKPATVTIYADQPSPGSSLPIWGDNVGHAFVSIEQNGKVSTFGFYPDADGVKGVHAPSVLGDNGGDNHNGSVSITVTGSTLAKVLAKAKNYPETYNVNFFNCTNYARNIGITAGINIPSAWGPYPGGGGQNPGKLGQIIKGIKSGNGITKSTGGKAPAKGSGCN